MIFLTRKIYYMMTCNLNSRGVFCPTMITFLIVLLVLVCIVLMAAVLMQASKGGGLAGLAGAGSSMTTMFGARRTSDFLQRFTIILATVFLLGSLLINIYISNAGTSVNESIIQQNSGQNQQPPPPTQQQQNTPPPNQQNPAGDQNQQQQNPDQNNGENSGQ
jgi:preprotein translocase subunit SecG